MQTFWLVGPRFGAQPLVSIVNAGPGVVNAEWSDSHGTPAYLADEHTPGALNVYFVNGDPRAAEHAAQAAAAARAERARREREEAATADLLLLSE